jgi:hypothetical protein
MVKSRTVAKIMTVAVHSRELIVDYGNRNSRPWMMSAPLSQKGRSKEQLRSERNGNCEQGENVDVGTTKKNFRIYHYDLCEGDIRVKHEIAVSNSKQFCLWLDEGTNNIDFLCENGFVPSRCGKLFVRFRNEKKEKK